MNNPNKAVSAKPYGIIVSYTDTHKHFKVDYQPSTLTKQQLYASIKQQEQQIRYYQSRKYLLLNYAFYGYDTYTAEELEQIPAKELGFIKKIYGKAQRVINRLKNEKVQQKMQGLFSEVFYKSALAKDLAEYEAEEALHQKNTMSLTDLGISVDTVIDQLIDAQVLPPYCKTHGS